MFVSEMINSGTSRKGAERVLPKITTARKRWSLVARSVITNQRVATVSARHAYLAEEDCFWNVIADEELKNTCQRIIGIAAPANTENFNADWFRVQTRFQ